MKDLIVPIKIETKELFTVTGVDTILKSVDDKITEFNITSTETKKDRDKIISFSAKIVKTKTFLEKIGKEFVAEKKAALKVFDSSRKLLRESLAEKAALVREPVTNYETAEAERVEIERQQEIFLMDWDEALGIDDLFNREKAMEAKEAEIERVEQERRDKEEAERLEKERIEREDRIKKEAALEAERKLAQAKIDAIAAKEKDERDRIALEERMKVEKEQAKLAKIEAARLAEIDKQKAVELATRQAEERARLAKVEQAHREAVEKAEADKKAANKKHRAAVNNKIVDALNHILKIHSADAKKIIVAIAQGNIPNVTINY